MRSLLFSSFLFRSARGAVLATIASCAFLICGCGDIHLHFFERAKDSAPPEVEVIIQPSEPKNAEPDTEIILPSKTKSKS